MEIKITPLVLVLCLVVLLVFAGGGFVGGWLARGGEAANARAVADKYRADYLRVEARVAELTVAFADAQKHGRESDAIIADLRGATIELAKLKREITSGLDASIGFVDRALLGVDRLENGLRGIPPDGGREPAP